MFSSAVDLNQKIALRESNFFGGDGKFTLNQIIISRKRSHSPRVRSSESRSACEAANTPCDLCELLSIRVVTKRRNIVGNRLSRTAIVSFRSSLAGWLAKNLNYAH